MKDEHLEGGRPDGLDPREAEALRALGGPVDPPDGLDDEVVAALARERLIGSSRRDPVGTSVGSGPPRWLLPAVAAVILFVAGWGTGRVFPAPASPGGGSAGTTDPSAVDHLAAEPLFVLLLVNSPSYDWPPDNQYAARVAEYAQWANDLRSEGRLILAEALVPAGAVVTPMATAASIRRFDDIELGDYTGFFVVRARDENHALELAQESPHFRHGGQVTVREILPT